MVSHAPLATLLPHESEFRRFLSRRLHNEPLARDVLQSAWLKALDGEAGVRDETRTVAWFYRVLRNAVIDLERRQARETRLLALAGRPAVDDDGGEGGAPCTCVHHAVKDLKPAWARLIGRVDLEGASVPQAARKESITPNNAAVRLHRARASLRRKLEELCGECARDACLDCDCA